MQTAGIVYTIEPQVRIGCSRAPVVLPRDSVPLTGHLDLPEHIDALVFLPVEGVGVGQEGLEG